MPVRRAISLQQLVTSVSITIKSIIIASFTNLKMNEQRDPATELIMKDTEIDKSYQFGRHSTEGIDVSYYRRT